MHSLKPTGDNIAHEFYNILKKAGVAGTSEEEVPAEVTTLDELVKQLEGGAAAEAQADMSERAANISLEEEGPMQSFEVSEASDNLLDMITDHEDPDAEDPVFGMLDDLTQSFEANASEKRVLEGLAKIASSLRGKGEAFAADVVLSTANSIKKDIVKEASKRSHIVSGLKKIASDLYSTGDQLAGDMVQVTISKLGGSED